MAREGTRVWADHPERETRLMDWIDEHPEEASIIFEKSSRGKAVTTIGHRTGADHDPSPTKNKCFELASHAVFSVDEDQSLQQKLIKNPTYFVPSTRGRILDGWKRYYQRFNAFIGEAASITPFEDIEVGSEMYHRINAQLVYFPLWKRLHVHWRTLPHFNPFFPASPSLANAEKDDVAEPADTSPSSGSPAKRRRRDLGQSDFEEPAGHADIKKNVDDAHIIDVDRLSEGLDVKEIVPDTATEIIQRKVNVLKRKHEEGSQGMPRLDSKEGRVELTTLQEHERKIAELAVKLQELENEALDKKTAADLRRLEIEAEAEERRRAAEHENQRAKEKHEMMMKMMTLAMMGKTGADGMPGS